MFFGHPAPWAEQQRQQNWSTKHLRENGQQSSTPLRYTQVYCKGQDPSEGTEGAGSSAHWVTFHLSPLVLANWVSPRQPEVSSVTPIYRKGWKDDPRNDSAWPECQGRLEEIAWSAITQQMQDNHGIRPIQHAVRKVLSDLPDPLLWPALWMEERLCILCT